MNKFQFDFAISKRELPGSAAGIRCAIPRGVVAPQTTPQKANVLVEKLR
jgi:hypothetical protein